MGASFLSPARTVLMISDEALYIYAVSSRETRLVDNVPWHTPDFAGVVANVMRKECGGKPVLILNDMTDQHFKGGQRLPRVGALDKKNILSRKLNVAFPNYPIRGALPIKEVTASGIKKSSAAGLYLFAAVPMSEAVTKTIEAVRRSVLPIAGFYLLPTESADMVRDLSKKLAGKKAPSRWVIFIGQHHSGALRQVIIRDGQLAMTRMTPITDMDSGPSAWAGEVSQEFKATLSYLSRFGFNPDDGTDVIIVCGHEAGQAFEQLIDIPCQYTYLTAPEAARELGIKLGMQDDPRYADPLHAAWAGKKTRFALPMHAPELAKVHRPRQAAAAAILLLFLGTGYLGWQLSTQFQTMMETKENLTLQRQVLAQAESDYQREINRMKAVGFDAEVVQGAIETYESLENKRLKTLSFTKRVDEALGSDFRLDAFSIEFAVPEQPKKNINRRAAKVAEARPRVKAALKISFPSGIEPAEGVREVNSLQRRLQQSFPEYNVIVEKNVAGLEYSDSFSGATGQSAEKIADEEYVAELIIEGDLPSGEGDTP